MKPFIRILHLEDEQNDIELVQTILEEAGLTCRINVVQTRDEFEKGLREDEYDIILADLRMPMYDGMLALRLARELRPDVPFVFVSGTIGEEAAIEGLKQGATDYVLKQNMLPLASAVERALHEAEERRERKRAEEALRESEELLRATIESTADGILVVDEKGMVTHTNKRFARMWQIPNELIRTREDKKLLDFVLDKLIEPEAFLSKVQTLYQTSDEDFDVLNFKDGRVFERFSSPLIRDRQIAGRVWSFRDISGRKQAERALRESEIKYRGIFNESVAAIYVFDAEKKFIDSNQAGLDLLGYTREELLNMSIADVDVDPTVVLPAHKQILGGERIINYEHKLKRKDGGIITVLNNSRPLTDAQSNVVGMQSTIIDITDRKWAEDVLRRSEEEKTILNQIANIFLTTSDEAMYREALAIVLQVMKSKFGIFGYIGKNGDLVLPGLTREIWDECLVTDKSVVFASDSWGNSLWGRAIREKKSFSSDGPFHTPAGHIPIDHFLAVPIVYGNETIGLISVANDQRSYNKEDRDILESIAGYISPILNARLQRDRQKQKRSRAEETLRKLSSAVEQSPVSIVITDTAGNIEYVNPQFMDVSGYSQTEILGKNPRILQSGEHPQRFYKELWETITSGKAWHGEFYNRRKTGEMYWESASISPIFDADDSITHFVGIKENITERKRLEAQFIQAQKMESIGRLAGGVAHDFNNMLGVIGGYTELALDRLDSTHPLFDDLQEIRKASIRSADLTRQLLAFARKQTVTPKVLELNKIIEGMLSMLRRLIGEDIELIWEPGKGVWPVRVDPSQIDQILANLCVNARDAMPGVGKLIIKTGNKTFDEDYYAGHPDIIPGEYALLAVSDKGHGMDKKTMERIFEPFFTTKEMSKGTGLGLSTVYGIVKQNKGFINVYSEPGDGTLFKIYLPRHLTMSEELNKKSSAILEVQGHETILLVEDDSTILAMGKRILERFGYRVLTAEKPSEAIRVTRENADKIHLLITDVVMPEMNGQELVDKLTTLYPKLKHLFMSGYTGDVIAYHGVLEEGENFIEKPFSMQALAAKVREILDAD